MVNEVIDFCAEDGVVLDGYIRKGEKRNEKVLIQIHGMSSNCFKKREKLIANEVQKVNVDTICFNTRGSDITKFIKDPEGNPKIAGSAFEDIEESYFDVLGAIKYAVSLGYEKIILRGHSLGCTKILYTYDKMKKENNEYLKYVKGIMLLSLVDIPDMQKTFSKDYIDYARNKYKEGKGMELMPEESYTEPISVKTFVQYIDNDAIDFARFHDKDDKFEVLNEIDVPLFMRWGNDNELIKQDAKELVDMMNEKIDNPHKDIGYIDGANHSYDGKQELLAEEICTFLDKIQ